MTNLHTDRNLVLLNAYWFLRDFQLWIPVWIVFLTVDQGFSLTEVLIAEGLFLVAMILLEVPTGVVADRYGRSRSLALGAFVLGAAVFAFAFATNFAFLLVSFLTWSLAATLMSGADNALLYDTLKAAGRTGEYEHRAGRGAAIAWVGIALATLLGGPVAALIDTESTIYIGAATCVLNGVVILMVREVRPETPQSEHPNLLATVRSAFLEIWRQPEVRAVVLLGGVTFAAIDSLSYLVQPYLLDRGIEVSSLFSALQVPIYAAGFAGALVSARVLRRFGLARSLLLIPFFAAVLCLALAFAPGLSAFLALPLMVGLSTCLQPIATGAINRRVTSVNRATVLSLYGVSSSLVMAVMAPGVGFTTDNAGLPSAFLLAGGLAAAALLAFGMPMFALRHRFEERIEPLQTVQDAGSAAP